MTEDRREGFLSRWSRRKLEREAASESPPESSSEDPFAGFDFDALDFGSNYRQFMAANVPDSVRNLALQKLWSSSDIISQPDELDD
jgi:hypothetical protein